MSVSTWYARHYPALSWSGSFSRDAAVLESAATQDAGPPPGTLRAQVAAALAEADRLADLVELIGVAALPDSERVGVLGGRLLCEGLLQQADGRG